MGLFDELLSQPGVTATGGGTGYDPRDDEMEVRFTAEGTPYNARHGTPLHEGHTRANQPMFDLPTVEVPTEPSLLNYGYDQTVQPPQQVDVNPTQEYIDPMSLYNRQGRADYIPQNIVDTNTVFGSPSLGSLPNPTQDASAMEALNKASAERDKQAQIEAQLQVLLKAQGLDNRAEWDMRRADDQFANLDKQYDINNQVATDDFGNPLLNANEHGQTSYDINAIKQESLDNLMMQDREPVVTPPVVTPTDNKPNYPSHLTPYAIKMLEEQRKRNEMFQGIGDTATGIYEGAKTLGSDIYDDVTGFDYKGLGSDIYKEGADAVQGAKDLYTDFNKPDTRTHRQRMIDNQTNVVEPVKEFITDTIPEFAGDAYEGILGPLVGNWYDNLSKDAEGPTQEYDSATGVQKPMVFNFKKSLATEVKGLVDAATSPVETADAIASVISGAVQHTLPDDMAWNEDSKKMAGAIGQMYAERYGSIDGFKKALAEDPVPVLIELTGAGLVSKVVAARTLASMKKIDMGEALEKFTDKAVETATMGMEKRGFRKELMVYHGSPHKFEKFDHKYMSSGEGGQMMGYGTYLAEHPSVAKTYAPRDMVMEDKLLKLYEDAMDFRRPGGEDVFAYEVYERALDHWTPKEISEYIKDTYKGDDLVKAEKALGNFKKMYGESDSYLYDIDLPDKTIAKMLDSDKTIMEQSDYVISALDDIYPNLSKEINNAKRIKQKLDKTTNKAERDSLFQDYADIKKRIGFNLDDNAHSLYRDLEKTLGSDKKASKLLEEKGIHGVKFWDRESRGSGEGTRNFVIFNENSAKVLKRNEVDIPNIDDGLLGQTLGATDEITELQSEIKRLKGLRGKDITQRTIDELRWAEEDLLKLNPLVAHHNMSSEALKKHSEYGGDIAMPSLGISKPDAPFGVTRDTTFGEIALLGDNSLIDPKKSNTFSSDAYTGRSPREMVVFDKDVEKIKDALGADTLKFHNRALYDKGLHEPEWLAIDLKTQELLEARGYKPEDYPSFLSMKRQATEDLGYKEVSYITVEATRNPVELGEMKRLIFPESGSKKEFTPKRALTEMRKQGGHKKGSEREIGDSDFLHDSRARAITSEKYQSLDKLVSERKRVQERSQYTHLEDEFSDMFDNTINDVEKVFKESFGDRMKPYKDGTKTYTSNLNRLDTLQVIQHILLGEKIPDLMQLNTSDIVKIKQLVKPLEKMGREMPTAYFESKPNRIVNIGEFKTAIVPKGDTKSIERLKKLGIKNIIEYKDQEGYLSAFKKNPELFFSKAIIPTGGLLGEDAISVEEEDEGEGLLSVKKKVEKPMNGVLDGVKPTKTVPSVTNNNPGNIKATNIKWDGMTGKNGDFVEFDNPENGIRALTRDLTNKRKRGLDTITKIITVYAPPSENDTKSYIKDVANDMGLSATDKLSDKNMYKMIKAMTKHEGGKEALKHFTDAIIKKGMKSAYKNKYQKFN